MLHEQKLSNVKYQSKTKHRRKYCYCWYELELINTDSQIIIKQHMNIVIFKFRFIAAHAFLAFFFIHNIFFLLFACRNVCKVYLVNKKK